MMTFANIAGVARPVRIVAKSSFACSTARSIFSSASRRVSSITLVLLLRSRLARRGNTQLPRSRGGDQRTDSLTVDGSGEGVLAFRAEDQHRKLVVAAQSERRRVHDAQALADRLVERHGVQLT